MFHVCIIIRKDNYENVSETLFKLFEFGKIIKFAIGDNPLHIHLLFKPNSFIPFNIFSRNGVYVKFIRIKSIFHYYNLVNYFHGHKIKGGGEMKEKEFVKFIVDSLKELKEKVGKLETEINELKNTQSRSTDRSMKSETVEINLSRMNVRLQQARKGVAMLIRFAKYIKPNNRNEYYVILTEEDINQLTTALQSIKIPKPNKSSGYKNNNIKVEKGGELG